MICNIYVFRSLEKVYVYIKEIHYYFQAPDSFLKYIELGYHRTSVNSILGWVSENYTQKYEELSYLFEIRQIKQYSQIQSIKEINGGEFFLCLHPSNKCNLACKYCFRNQEGYSTSLLTYETAKKAIEYLIYTYAPNATKYLIDLSGSGEPLLNFPLIKK